MKIRANGVHLTAKISAGVLLWPLLIVGARTSSAAEPYLPTQDDVVLEQLPTAFFSQRAELTALREELAKAPQDIKVAARVAQRFLAIGSQAGDPRFYGYARSALTPWWDVPQPPVAVLKLRAKLQEKEHLYDAAVADLERLLAIEPENSQAWIEIANIYRVQGKYQEARRACAELEKYAGHFPTALARIPLQAATGQAEVAYSTASQLLPEARRQWPSTVAWLITMQAQIAVSLGKEELAEAHFREGLANNSDDRYLLREYADFLLDHKRPSEVISLLTEHTQDNGILLALAIAARRAGQIELARKSTNLLSSRFAEIQLRGGDTHGKYEARAELELKDNPEAALAIALTNWNSQKDFRDSRNVLEAALAAKKPQAAQPVVNFLRQHRTQDVVLQRLIQQLEPQ